MTVLYLLSIFGLFIVKKAKFARYILWGGIFLLLNLMPQHWMRKELIFLLPFFVTAIAFSMKSWERIPTWIGISAFILYLVCLQYFTFEDTMYRMSDEFFSKEYHYHAILRYTIGFLGIISAFWICKYASRIPHLSNAITYIGGLTLPIYVIHQNILLVNTYTKIFTDNIFVILFSTIIIIAVSIGLYLILRRELHIRLLLFGEQ